MYRNLFQSIVNNLLRSQIDYFDRFLREIHTFLSNSKWNSAGKYNRPQNLVKLNIKAIEEYLKAITNCFVYPLITSIQWIFAPLRFWSLTLQNYNYYIVFESWFLSNNNFFSISLVVFLSHSNRRHFTINLSTNFLFFFKWNFDTSLIIIYLNEVSINFTTTEYYFCAA